jgi:Spy/CpxP family protein refolding chaperone
MSLRTIIGVLCLSSTLGVVTLAQEPQAPTTAQTSEFLQRREGLRRMRGQGFGRKHRPGFGLADLNLTDAQKEQTKAILQRHLDSTRAQREELLKLREKRQAESFTAEDGARAKELHQQLRDSMQGVRGELASLLTPEQRTQFEQIQSQRMERQKEKLQRRAFRNRIPRQ